MGKDQELLEAARSGQVAIVEKILGQRAKRSGPLASLRRGPGANVQDSSGYTSLHHAALNGHRDIVRLLLEHDASTNIVDTKGSTPLHLAAWSGNVDIARLLLRGHTMCNVNLTTKDDETALHCAAQYGHTEVVKLLLEYGCDPGIRNKRGETALDLAAQYGRLESVELLVRTHPSSIQHMERIPPGTIFKHTPLHLASRNGHKSVVEVLLRAGVDVNIRTHAGTALHEAALCGKSEVVRTLLENGVDLSIRDANKCTVKDLLSQFPANATLEIMGLLKRYRKLRASHFVDSDADSISQPFPMPNVDSDLGSPYENVRPSSRGRSVTDPSPGSSPHRWDFRHARSVECVEDRRISGNSATSMRTNKSYQSLPPKHRIRSHPTNRSMHECHSPWLGISFSFNEKLKITNQTTAAELDASSTSSSSYRTASDCSRESENSLYQIPCVPRAFMDSSIHSDDLQLYYNNREIDQISLSSTASSTGYPRRPDSGGTPHYVPMNARGGHSPGSNSKVSPTPPKKPPRRNLSVSPTHQQPMSVSVDGYNNHAYEYVYLAKTGTRSQNNINEIEHEHKRERLIHGRSVDQYVEMNAVFNIPIDDECHRQKELHRGKSEDLDCRRREEPVAITSVYENMTIKQQNPRRKLRRNQDVYEEYDFRTATERKKDDNKSSLPAGQEATFVSSAFIMVKDDYSDDRYSSDYIKVNNSNSLISYPLSPTHYHQPPTPDHPPPSALQAESCILDKIRPLSQEYKRRSKDMETETEDEYLLIYDESSGSFSSSVSLSDRSVDNIVEEYQSDAPFAGLIKGSTKAVECTNSNKPTPAERPKTLKKLKRVYDSSNGENAKNDHQKSCNNSSGSDKESENKENRERVSALSPFDEQEEWAKIQEIMASFGTGLVRESVFVAELEKEFQSRLMSLSFSQNSISAENICTIERWLESLDMEDYVGLFMNNGFDDLEFLNGVLEETDLKEMGIASELERQIILDGCKHLPFRVNEQAQCNNNNLNEQSDSVDGWLRRIHLEQYSETFAKHLYHNMERIKRIWDVELSAVLDIEKIGHRKRILASVSSGEHITTGPKLEDINADLNTLKNNIQQLKSEINSPSTHSANSNTGTIRHRHKKSRPAPPPPVKVEEKKVSATAEIFVGGANSIKAQWRHQPILLITGVVKYNVNYLGSTVVKEFKGTESTKKSIQKIRKTADRGNQEIVLSISYRGLKFIDLQSKDSICEHEIRNVHCACQDPECRLYFAYITKDSNDYYCHIFSTNTAEQATDIILTLGQAFELAYQMALREQVTSKAKSSKDLYKPAVSPGSISSHSRDFKDGSASKTDLKLNGHPLKMKPLTLSIAAECVIDTQTQRTPTKTNFSDAET